MGTIAVHDPIAQHFVGRFHRIGIDRELALARILRQQF